MLVCPNMGKNIVQRRGFQSRRWRVCPACLDRDAIACCPDRPRVYNGVKLTYGCEVCAGRGEIPVLGKEQRDPYDLNRGWLVGG